MENEFEGGAIKDYSLSIDKKTKGEVTWHISVHKNTIEEIEDGIKKLKEIAIRESDLLGIQETKCGD